MNTEGVLPGPLNVPRRAVALRRQLVSSDNISNDPMNVIDWINMYALAVSEENAAGGRVVTAPTNGACGIIPAVLAYYDKFRRPVNERSIARYFLAAGAIGALYKMNASISGAEVGCQGEIGGFLWIVILHRGRFEQITTRGIMMMIVLTIYYGFSSAGIDNWGHIGGLLAGFSATVILYHRNRQKY